MNQRAVLAGALCLFAIGLGVYVLTLRTERDTARTEAQEARQDAATWKACLLYTSMLAPRELYRAQGFPDTYVIAPECGGKPISKTAQVRMCGNSVPPQFVAALVTANGPGTWAEEAKPHLPLLAYLPPRRAGMEARV